MMTLSEKELDGGAKENEFFYQVVSKELMSVIKEKTNYIQNSL